MESAAMSRATALAKNSTASWSLPVFTALTRSIWVVIVAVTILSEVIPIPLLPPLPFYLYVGAKLILFSAVGYLTPLAFWRFNALNRGIVLATLSAAAVEGLQALILHGHSFHWYEMAVKLALILLGFALALDARYERVISIGAFRIRLTGAQLKP